MSITSYQPVSQIIRVTIIKRAIFHFSLLILDDVCYTRRHRDENRYCPTSLVHPFSSNQDLSGQIRDERERPFFFLFNLVNYLRASDVLFFVSFSTLVYSLMGENGTTTTSASLYTLSGHVLPFLYARYCLMATTGTHFDCYIFPALSYPGVSSASWNVDSCISFFVVDKQVQQPL